MSICAETVIKGKQIIFIDCDHTFSKERILQILKYKYDSSIGIPSTAIQLYPTFSFEYLTNLFHSIVNEINTSNTILIIDSITSIFLTSDYLCEVNNHITYSKRKQIILCQLCQMLKWVSHQTKLPIIVTRLDTSEIQFKWEAFLDADLSISLERDETSSQIKATITNRIIQNQLNNDGDNEIMFDINNQGIS